MVFRRPTSLSRLNIRFDSSLAQRFLYAKFHRVFPNCGIAFRNDDNLAVNLGSLVGERLDDFVVDIVPILPRKCVDFVNAS